MKKKKNKTEIDDKPVIIDEQADTTVKVNKKEKLVNFLKNYALIFVFAIAYFFSVYLNGFYNTNLKFLNLLIFGLVGFLSFFIIYYLLNFISFISLKKKVKNQAKNVVNCDDELAEYFQYNSKPFKYKGNVPLKENMKEFVNKTVEVMNDIACKYNQQSKYAFINYTVYDAIDILGNATAYLHNGIDKYFKGLNLQDWSFINLKGLIEKNAAADETDELAVTDDEKQSKGFFAEIKNKIVSGGKKIGNHLISAPLTSLLNDALIFVAGESFRVFSKNGKKTKADDCNERTD